MHRLRWFPAVFAPLGLACAAAIAVSPTEAAGSSVLFIGNSLTASNDLAAALAVECTLFPRDRPGLVAAAAASGLALDARRRDALIDAACRATSTPGG
jgi:hypothetical protein